jgi:hypothetical protein
MVSFLCNMRPDTRRCIPWLPQADCMRASRPSTFAGECAAGSNAVLEALAVCAFCRLPGWAVFNIAD